MEFKQQLQVTNFAASLEKRQEENFGFPNIYWIIGKVSQGALDFYPLLLEIQLSIQTLCDRTFNVGKSPPPLMLATHLLI